MSMSTHVVGVRDLDGEFAKWAKIKEACDEAGSGYPQQMVEYFRRVSRMSPVEALEDLRREAQEMNIDAAVSRDPSRDSYDTWVVDLSKLPADVKAIRFSNSY